MVTCLGSPSCTLKPELPDDMGMRRCGGAHPAFVELVLFRFSIVLVRKDTTVVSNIRPGVRIFSNVKAFGARC